MTSLRLRLYGLLPRVTPSFAAILLCFIVLASPKSSNGQANGLGGEGRSLRAARPNLLSGMPLRFEATSDHAGMVAYLEQRSLQLRAGGTVDILAQVRGATAMINIRLEGGDSRAPVRGVGPLPGRTHYFLGGGSYIAKFDTAKSGDDSLIYARPFGQAGDVVGTAFPPLPSIPNRTCGSSAMWAPPRLPHPLRMLSSPNVGQVRANATIPISLHLTLLAP